ncbi:hypothetical protein HELRODRAFT_187984 [Helobdella robusta]|uniref:Cadherin domain-containing protein n=1 Tax=Helobdella robusta TaxID=6412 RepID=T1FPI8_HELRO|nr:hypothetical protein HELRODRAFT_187984 [Helobdella robusta]ESO12799.1 hypothetical protein HELRODRAFT_187984 [Helobdella robusta]
MRCLVVIVVVVVLNSCYVQCNVAPEFVDLPTVIYLPDSAAIGTVVVTLKAVDLDDTTLTFSVAIDDGDIINNNINNNNNDIFKINQISGQTAQITSQYKVIFSVKDSINVPISQPCVIVIISSSFKPPSLNNLPSTINVSEDAINGTEVFRVVAADSLSVVTFKLEPSQAPFRIDQLTGSITLVGFLDFHLQRTYVITVVAANKKGANTSATLTINITSNRNKPPYFLVPRYFSSILENTPTPLLSQQQQQQQQLTNDIFTIDEKTGSIQTSRLFDCSELYLRWTNCMYDILIEACSSSPTRSQGSNCSTTLATVAVSDLNNHAPVFSSAKYRCFVNRYVSEDGDDVVSCDQEIWVTDADLKFDNVLIIKNEGSLIYDFKDESLEVKAYSSISSSLNVIYEILGPFSNTFSIDAVKGQISIARPDLLSPIISNNGIPVVVLIVSAKNRDSLVNSCSSLVVVQIKNNDVTGPRIASIQVGSYVGVIEEQGKQFLYPVVIRPQMISANNNNNNYNINNNIINNNNNFTFNIVNNNMFANNFTIDQATGQFLVKYPLDFEAIPPYLNGTINISVEVTAVKNSMQAKGLGSVVVIVKDVNDRIPSFVQTSYTFELQEPIKRASSSQPTTTKTLYVTATDLGTPGQSTMTTVVIKYPSINSTTSTTTICNNFNNINDNIIFDQIFMFNLNHVIDISNVVNIYIQQQQQQQQQIFSNAIFNCSLTSIHLYDANGNIVEKPQSWNLFVAKNCKSIEVNFPQNDPEIYRIKFIVSHLTLTSSAVRNSLNITSTDINNVNTGSILSSCGGSSGGGCSVCCDCNNISTSSRDIALVILELSLPTTPPPASSLPTPPTNTKNNNNNNNNLIFLPPNINVAVINMSASLPNNTFVARMVATNLLDVNIPVYYDIFDAAATNGGSGTSSKLISNDGSNTIYNSSNYAGVYDSISASSYFKINQNTGIIYLIKEIPKDINRISFSIRAYSILNGGAVIENKSNFLVNMVEPMSPSLPSSSSSSSNSKLLTDAVIALGVVCGLLVVLLCLLLVFICYKRRRDEKVKEAKLMRNGRTSYSSGLRTSTFTSQAAISNHQYEQSIDYNKHNNINNSGNTNNNNNNNINNEDDECNTNNSDASETTISSSQQFFQQKQNQRQISQSQSHIYDSIEPLTSTNTTTNNNNNNNNNNFLSNTSKNITLDNSNQLYKQSLYRRNTNEPRQYVPASFKLINTSTDNNINSSNHSYKSHLSDSAIGSSDAITSVPTNDDYNGRDASNRLISTNIPNSYTSSTYNNKSVANTNRIGNSTVALNGVTTMPDLTKKYSSQQYLSNPGDALYSEVNKNRNSEVKSNHVNNNPYVISHIVDDGEICDNVEDGARPSDVRIIKMNQVDLKRNYHNGGSLTNDTSSKAVNSKAYNNNNNNNNSGNNKLLLNNVNINTKNIAKVPRINLKVEEEECSFYI